ncbi:MAG: adenylate/guanylate cyclase domain-containing protein [Actinomycetia bacterium]|nr:adenylate/guanylate cyclase domain-containing protein [Actinomycetes bacterium]
MEPLHAAGADVDLRDVIPENPAGIYLQVNYGLDGGPAGDRDAIDDADDGSRWSEVHATVHPVYRDIVDLLDLVDLFLIEPESGYVVYSVKKGPDLGTSLVAGPYSGSTLATIVDRSARESDNATVVGDLGFYLPALAEPVGFVASPVLDGDRLVGFLVLMYDSGPLNEILSAGGQWEDAGFPETGESLLFGGDSKVRTEPRSFIEDPAAHLSASVEAGLAESDLHVIRVTGTTVLTQSVAEPTLRAAIRGDDSVGERPNLLGIPTLSVVSAVPLPDLDWYVLSEVHLEVGERDLREFGELLVVGVALFVVILAFGVVGWAGRLVLPIRQISDELRSDSDGVVPLDVSASSPVEFHQLAESFESMANRIASQKARVATTRADRLALLRKMLPPAVAERIAAGETQTIDEIPQASVAVVVVEGLGDLVRRDATTASRGLVDRLLADLDDLARRHHLDRFNVVGDAYFAACGLNRPFIDHVPRAVSFAAEASIVVRELGEQSPVDLDVTAGIHTGSVMAGVTGSDRSVYDVWGETVTTAHYLARAAGRGHIVVSDEARAMLPDTIDVTPEPGFDGAEVWSVDIESTRGRP